MIPYNCIICKKGGRLIVADLKKSDTTKAKVLYHSHIQKKHGVCVSRLRRGLYLVRGYVVMSGMNNNDLRGLNKAAAFLRFVR